MRSCSWGKEPVQLGMRRMAGGRLEAARGGWIGLVAGAVVADEMNDQPDDARGEGAGGAIRTVSPKPVAKTERSPRTEVEAGRSVLLKALARSPLMRLLSPRRRGAKEDGDIAGDGAVGIAIDGAEKDGDIAVDVALEVDGAEHAGDVAGGAVFRDVDGGEDADAILSATVGSVGRKGKGSQKERNGEEKRRGEVC